MSSNLKKAILFQAYISKSFSFFIQKDSTGIPIVCLSVFLAFFVFLPFLLCLPILLVGLEFTESSCLTYVQYYFHSDSYQQYRTWILYTLMDSVWTTSAWCSTFSLIGLREASVIYPQRVRIKPKEGPTHQKCLPSKSIFALNVTNPPWCPMASIVYRQSWLRFPSPHLLKSSLHLFTSPSSFFAHSQSSWSTVSLVFSSLEFIRPGSGATQDIFE